MIKIQGLKCAKQFHKDHHIESVNSVINEMPDDATMFGMQCSQPYYFKFIKGVLHTLSRIDNKSWISTDCFSLTHAYREGIIPIYSIEELINEANK